MSITTQDESRRLTLLGSNPVAAPESERDTIARVEEYLLRQRGTMAKLVGPDGETIELPASAYEVLRAAIHQLSLDNAVSIVPVHKQLTTQQAADLLNISRPFLIQLLERGEIPFERVGTHRRLKFGDVMAYRDRRAAEEEAAIDQLAVDGFDLGL